MIVYSSNQASFIQDVRSNTIHTKILERIKLLGVGGGSPSEIDSWRNSMQFMCNAVDTPDIPPDAGVSIEYAIPLTSKRVDFILTGKNEALLDQVVVVELKQWSNVSRSKKDAVVETYVGGAVREMLHPSYQAWSYTTLIEDYNATVRDENIELHPCAYLHNLDSDDVINDPFYAEHTHKAPAFGAAQGEDLQAFLRQHIKYGDRDRIMYRIEHGKIKPSRDLADSIQAMLAGNREFEMIDDQKIVYETVLDCARHIESGKKQVIVVEGGPGTGKSVVAINLLAQLTQQELVAQYVSKNSAPRSVYAAKLSGTMRKNRINNLFKGSAAYTNLPANTLDVVVVDEAHRLMAKNRYNRDSQNQIMELIRASKLAVFFLDEDQTVTWSDIGSKAEIKKWTDAIGIEPIEMALESQFRCSGSDGFLAWLDDVLQIRSTANQSLIGNQYEFTVCDDPNQLRRTIESRNENNSARMVAGYCWDWISDARKAKNDPDAMDITIPEYGFAAQWNLSKQGSLWIMSEDSVSEVGCIHTCQGLELDHVGVILGPDLLVRDGVVVTDASARSRMDSTVRGYKKLLKEDPTTALSKADRIIKNTYRTLMTRGRKSCSVFSVDAETNEYFVERSFQTLS